MLFSIKKVFNFGITSWSIESNTIFKKMWTAGIGKVCRALYWLAKPKLCDHYFHSKLADHHPYKNIRKKWSITSFNEKPMWLVIKVYFLAQNGVYFLAQNGMYFLAQNGKNRLIFSKKKRSICRWEG